MCVKAKRIYMFMRRGQGYERICYACRDNATPEDWAEARRQTHKAYEAHRA